MTDFYCGACGTSRPVLGKFCTHLAANVACYGRCLTVTKSASTAVSTRVHFMHTLRCFLLVSN